jgi:hypothetical protein
VIKAPVIDPNEIDLSVDSLEEFSDLTLIVETGDGDWECVLSDVACTGPNGEEVGL